MALARRRSVFVAPPASVAVRRGSSAPAASRAVHQPHLIVALLSDVPARRDGTAAVFQAPGPAAVILALCRPAVRRVRPEVAQR